MAKRAKTPLPFIAPDVLKILLDEQNPRIEVDKGVSQPSIREKLLDEENVIDLAVGIIKNKGLMIGERIIVVKENGKYVVLEGNRRTCACQLLVDPSLIPETYKGKFPAADEDLKEQLTNIPADLAATREIAESTITKRHTESGIKQWTPQAKQRRIARMIAAGKAIDDVAALFQSSASSVRKTLREHALLQKARNLKCWTPAESSLLHSPKLQTNPFTRFFTLKETRDRIPFTIDDKGRIATKIGDKEFDEVIEGLSRSLLFPNTKFNTRSTSDEVFKAVVQIKPSLKRVLVDEPSKLGKGEAKSSGAAATGVQLKAKSDKFFESLICPIQDNSLINISQEISTINYKTYKTAATFLLRALIENTLVYCVKKKALWNLLMAEVQGQPWTQSAQTCPTCNHSWTPVGKKQATGNREPGLDAIITFCINHQADIFLGNAQRVLNSWRTIKDVADLVIHGKWVNANATSLEHAASIVRPFIMQIFDGTALKS